MPFQSAIQKWSDINKSEYPNANVQRNSQLFATIYRNNSRQSSEDEELVYRTGMYTDISKYSSR